MTAKTTACACGRPATIDGQCNGCREIGQYVNQIARKPANLNEHLLEQTAAQDERVQKLLDGFAQDIADLDAVSRALRRFPNAKIG